MTSTTSTDESVRPGRTAPANKCQCQAVCEVNNCLPTFGVDSFSVCVCVCVCVIAACFTCCNPCLLFFKPFAISDETISTFN